MKRTAQTGRHRRPGFFVMELLAATILLGTVAAMLGYAAMSYHRTREAHMWREAIASAAEAQWQRIAAGAPLDSSLPEGLLASDIELKGQASPGQGPWAGLQLVTVTAKVMLPTGRPIEERISGYVRLEGRP